MLTMNDSTVSRMFEAVQLFRTLDAEIHSQAIALFLLVAERPGITMLKAAEVLGTSGSSVSRNAMMLAKRRRQGDPGLELIYTEDNPDNLREKIMGLTNKGKLLVERLRNILEA